MTFQIACHNIDNDIHVRDCYCSHFLNLSFDYCYGNDDEAQLRLVIAEVQIGLGQVSQRADHLEVLQPRQRRPLNLQPMTGEAMDRRRVVGGVVKIVPAHHHSSDADVCQHYYYCYSYDLENRWDVLLPFLATVVEMKFHAYARLCNRNLNFNKIYISIRKFRKGLDN